eukprot:5944132-Alexandrium_andersonii.AAC.1
MPGTTGTPGRGPAGASWVRLSPALSRRDRAAERGAGRRVTTDRTTPAGRARSPTRWRARSSPSPGPAFGR